MKRRILLLFGVLTLGFKGVAQQAPPNIVVFFVDDLGWQDLSEPFHTSKTAINRGFRTPNVEKLAKNAVKFTNAYATSVCTPSRISFLTGINAAHHRVTNYTHPYANTPTDSKDDLLTPPEWNVNGLSPIASIPKTIHATTFPQILKDHGYFTVHVGKAHWGSAGTPGADPTNLGFIVNVAGHSAGHPQSYYGEDNYGNIPGKSALQAVPDLMEYYKTPTFLTEALTQKAIQAIETPINRKEPFFLNFSNYAVHEPIQADPRFVQRYLDLGMEEKEAAYASLVEGFDKSIGDIISYLKEKQVYDNTIIVFVSDNGGLSLHRSKTKPEHTQNLPLKAGKGSLYEGGIRVPLLVKGAKDVTARISDVPVIIEDLFPTILNLAGIRKYKTVQSSIDGKDISELMTSTGIGSKWDKRLLVWNYPNKWRNIDGPGINFYSAARQGDFKLLYNMKKGQLELYNLKDDIGEMTDLAQRMPEKVKELSKLLSNQLRSWEAQLPTYKTGEKIPYPDQINK